jgi:hypothetical protein
MKVRLPGEMQDSTYEKIKSKDFHIKHRPSKIRNRSTVHCFIVHGCNGITEIKQSRKQEGEKQSSY